MTAKKKDTTTPQQPETTPSRVGVGSDAWLLMQVGDLSGSIKALTQSIDHLAQKVDKLEQSSENLITKVNGIDKKIYAATIIIGLFVAVGGFVANKAIDFGLDMAKQTQANYLAPQAQQPQAQTIPAQSQLAPSSDQTQK